MHKPTPEAIAADIYATAQAHKAGVITDGDRDCRLAWTWAMAARHALTDATVRALATIDADARPFGPGTLDVLLAAESADPGAVCDAIEAIAGEGCEPMAVTSCDQIVITLRTVAALVRALRGGQHGA